MNIGRLTGVGFGQNQFTVGGGVSKTSDLQLFSFVTMVRNDDLEPAFHPVDSEPQGESFDDVFDEMCRNVPDQTSTIEEKQLAISYIDRLLACSDISPELKTYWENKKNIIQMEILRIDNYNKTGTGESVNDVFGEMKQNVPDSTSTIEEKMLAISYIDRLLACTDITPELKTYWENKKAIIEQEIQRINNEKKSGSGENVEDVMKEFQDFVKKYGRLPDSSLSPKDRLEYSTTLESTYISFYMRLLSCDDITPEERNQFLAEMNQRIFELQQCYNDYINSNI